MSRTAEALLSILCSTAMIRISSVTASRSASSCSRLVVAFRRLEMVDFMCRLPDMVGPDAVPLSGTLLLLIWGPCCLRPRLCPQKICGGFGFAPGFRSMVP